ncbi:MAG: zf-HC2 domain-containing protein, partial [Candidatus Geothermincolia bacterium]
QRVALTLRDIEGWSYNDIADFMGLSRTAAGVLLSRARLKFKKEYRLQEIDAGRLEPECRDLIPLMSAVLDGEATDSEKEIVQEHLRTCPACRACMDDLAGASTTLRSMVPLLPALALKTALVAKATAVGFATGAAVVSVGVGMSAAMKAIVGIAASLLVAGAGVGTYIGVKSVTSPGPAPSVKIVKPLDGVALTVDAQADGTGKVPLELAVDNKPTAVEIAIDGQAVKRFDGGPYSFEWTTGAAGPHTVKPTAFDSSGKAHAGPSVTFTLAIKKKMGEKIAYLQGGNIFTIGTDGAGAAPVTSAGDTRDFATSPATGQIAFINVARIMYLMNYDGGGVQQVTLPEKGTVGSAAFSRDGKYIYFSRDVREAGDADYQSHVQFERYDIAANKVVTIYRIPEAFQDESIGGLFTDAAGDYLYYNHFGSDFPSSSVYRISLKGTVTDAPFMPPQTDVQGTRVVMYMLQSLSADGSHISYQRQAVMDREPPPGSQIGSSIELSSCLRLTAGGEAKVLETVDLSGATTSEYQRWSSRKLTPTVTTSRGRVSLTRRRPCSRGSCTPERSTASRPRQGSRFPVGTRGT